MSDDKTAQEGAPIKPLGISPIPNTIKGVTKITEWNFEEISHRPIPADRGALPKQTLPWGKRLKGWILTLLRRRFGRWVLSIDRPTGAWVLANHWRDCIYVEKTGQGRTGALIEIPKKTQVRYE